MFEEIDKNHDGRILIDEIRRDWKEKGIFLNDQSLEAIFKGFDLDSDGKITVGGIQLYSF